MIYRVVLDDETDIHTPDIENMLLNPSLELEMNSAGSFNFTLPPRHPAWNRIEILKSTIDVYEDNDLIFTGRVANIDKNWNNERVVECEGALAYFNDSIHRQMKWENPLPIAVDPDDQPEDPSEHVQNFLEDILNNHNAFVGNATNRQIHMGHIYVDPYLVTREVNYDVTLDILTKMCIDTNGGYFMIRKDPESHLLYLDWLKDFTEESGQPASFGVNLLDFNTGLHAEDICTGVLARGATVNDQVVTLTNVELVDKDTYPDMSVDHYTDRYQDILWHRKGVEKFGQVVQVHEFPDAQTDWKNSGQVVANSLFEEARKWLEEKNTKVESIEVEVAELSWLREGVPKYKLGQIVEILDDAHMAGEPYEVRRLPMYKLSCDLSSGSKKVTLGRPPKKELTQISASNSDSSTLSSGNSSGSSSGGGSGSGEECKVHDVRVDGTSVVSNKIANISLTGKADVNTVNALAATVATKADASTVTALANVVSGKQDQIEFNTLEAATETLTRLKADNKVYNLGGGTEVVANPSESATDDLNTIKIGNTVYDIPGSGSSTNYGKFKCDLLFVNDPLPAPQDCRAGLTKNYTLTKSIDDYDAVYFVALTSYQTQGATDDDCVKTIVFKQDYYNPTNTVMVSSFTDGRYLKIYFTSDTTMQTTAWTSQSFYCPIIYKVYGLKFENKLINRSDIYSEEERMIGRWMDGKPLYQKTVIINNPSSGKNNFQHGLQNVDHILCKEWHFTRIDGSILTNAVGEWASAILSVGANGGQYKVDSGWSVNKLYITLQYTKTTDTPDSGFLPEDPQMVMMSDIYSEDEHVVGRWTDGKPLYQKTIRIQNSTMSSGMITKDISNLNPEMCFIDYSGSAFHDILNNNWMSLDWVPAQASMSYAVYVYSDITLNGNKVIIINSQNPWSNRIDDMYITIQYTKTTDAPGTGPTKGNLIYLPALYSEEEREVGVWTDGKPLYQKTIITTNTTINNWVRVDISSLNIDKLCDLYGQFTRYVNNEDYLYNFTGAESLYSSNYVGILRFDFENGDGELTYRINCEATNKQIFTIQYTKTTDTPGSGTWTPEGQLAHHYSTSEKIVGTWIDGSTVYERTIQLTANLVTNDTAWTQVQYDNPVTNMSHLIDCKVLDGTGTYLVERFSNNNQTLSAASKYSGTVYNAGTYMTIQYTKSS